MGRHSLLLSGTSGVLEGGLSWLDRRDDRETGQPALEPPVDLPEGCLEVSLAKFIGILRAPSFFQLGREKL
jgi:hypothetical protein